MTVEVILSLADTQEGTCRINDNRYFARHGEWIASNVWQSEELPYDEESEPEDMVDMIDYTLEGLEYDITCNH